MNRFIICNNRILDHSKFKSEFSLMKNIIQMDIKEYFLQLDFSSTNNSKNMLKFYKKDLDMEISVRIKKKSRFQYI